MIQTIDLHCGYGKKNILSDININIKKGEITCILGRNGAGKTTLFKTILGLIPPLQGTITFNGKPIQMFSQKELAKEISYVPQAHGTPFPFSVKDVVTMGQFAHTSGLFGMPDKQNKEIAIECIHTLGIKDLGNRSFSELSGGEKQMVLIARAMAQQPKFIAMDEPTSNLDIGNQIKVMKIALQLKEKGYGLIINTHSPEHVMNYADKVVLLKDGKIKAEGDPAKIMNSALVSEIYNTRVELLVAQKSCGGTAKVCVAV